MEKKSKLTVIASSGLYDLQVPGCNKYRYLTIDLFILFIDIQIKFCRIIFKFKKITFFDTDLNFDRLNNIGPTVSIMRCLIQSFIDTVHHIFAMALLMPFYQLQSERSFLHPLFYSIVTIHRVMVFLKDFLHI